LAPAPHPGSGQTISLPVLVFETEAHRTAQTEWAYRFSPPPSSTTAARLEREIAAGVFGRIAISEWKPVDGAVRDRIHTVLRRKIDGGALPNRVRDHMLRLAANASWDRPQETVQ
jgi:hypothetical protein